MKILKKALSTVLTATLLASLLGTAFASTAFAAADNTTALSCLVAVDTDACSQVADGASVVKLDATAIDWDTSTAGTQNPPAGSIVATVDAPAFTTNALVTAWVLSNSNKTATNAVSGADNLAPGETLTLTSPTIPGTTTVTVVHQSNPDAVTGVVTTTALGTMTVTWVSAGNLAVSEANSTVKFVAPADACSAAALTSNVADKSLNPAAKLCVTLKDGNGNLVTTGATVGVTIQPVGLVAVGAAAAGATAGTAQVASTSTNASGVYAFGIGGSGIANTASIAISVTQGSVTTTFAAKTFTFSGALATLAASQSRYAHAKGSTQATALEIATIEAKDAGGNAVGCNTAWTVTSGTTTVIPSSAFSVAANSDGDCAIWLTSAAAFATAGSTAVTLKNASGTIAAAPFTYYISTDVSTVTVTFSAATINPGGQATITVEAKDASGRPVADAASPGNPLVSAGAATAWSSIRNGKATATYLAPFNAGVVTALASITTNVSTSTTKTGSGSATVGAPAPIVTSGTNASALGATKTGTYTIATKVAAVGGQYQTFKLCYGAGAAGQTVGILVATKNSAGVWSSFTRLTGRVADSAGCAYFWWRTDSAAWISVRGDVSGTLTNAVQARWR